MSLRFGWSEAARDRRAGASAAVKPSKYKAF
jgi:hypothetical protein